MEVASICSGNGIASSLGGAMLSAPSRDFGMLDTLSCAQALARDEERQGCRQFAWLLAHLSQENEEPTSNRRGNFRRGLCCSTLHRRSFLSIHYRAKSSEPNNRIKTVRRAHSTVQ